MSSGIASIVDQLLGTSRIPASAAPRTVNEQSQRAAGPQQPVYAPKRGTLAARVFELLAPGQSMPAREIGWTLGVSASAVRSTCLTPMRLGALRFERDEGGALVIRRVA